MQIKVPIESAYYYECTGTTMRLLYWIPPEVLKELISQSKVDAQILEDYPDGIDVKVSERAFAEIARKYHLEFHYHPMDLWNAFRALRLKEKKDFMGTGFIDRQFLESLAARIRKDVLPSEYWQQRIPDKYSQRKREIKLRTNKFKKIARDLKSYCVREFNEQKSLAEQSFARVKMSKGSDPAEVFNKFRKHARGGK